MRVLSVVALLLVVAPVIDGGAADAQESLARARLLYNERQFEEAVNAADEARAGFPDSVDLIAARAYLERFRESAANDNLASARDRLRRINPGGFGIPERIEFIIGLGQALYFDNSPGAAVSLFASVLDGVHVLGPDARERVLDWWASALDGEARPRADAERVSLYREIQERMERELADRPGSAVAAYWFVAAASGEGRFDIAWDRAKAAWIRAPLTSDFGAMLRGDLDRLVQRAIVPERAKAAAKTTEQVLIEWEFFKEQWSR